MSAFCLSLALTSASEFGQKCDSQSLPFKTNLSRLFRQSFRGIISICALWGRWRPSFMHFADAPGSFTKTVTTGILDAMCTPIRVDASPNRQQQAKIHQILQTHLILEVTDCHFPDRYLSRVHFHCIAKDLTSDFTRFRVLKVHAHLSNTDIG